MGNGCGAILSEFINWLNISKNSMYQAIIRT